MVIFQDYPWGVVRSDTAVGLACGMESAALPQSTLGDNGLKVPSVIGCLFLLMWLKLLLLLRGFGGAHRWLRSQARPPSGAWSASLDFVRAAEYKVALAAALYPGRAKCLEQSLALYYVLRRQGIAAIYCQGVQPFPFQAHAWIEYQGEVVNDVAEHARGFSPLHEPLG